MDECRMLESCHEPCIFFDVLRDIDTGIIILDTSDEVVFFKNNHAVKILESVRAPHDYNGLIALLREEIRKLRRSGDTRSAKTVIRSGHRVLGYTVYRLADDSRYISVFIQDITDQNRLDAIDEATEMMNNMGLLFSGIRHEIGNPINSIKMALTVLKNNVRRYSPKEIKVYFDRIFGEITKMEALLKSFKNFNMFEQPRTGSVDLITFFDDLTHLIGPDIKSRNIDLCVDLLPELRWAEADSRALQHVVMNVLANSMDALSDQSDARLIITNESRRGSIVLSIVDNGCGMSEDLVRDAFKPFFTTKKHGTGLGLVITRKMLAQMNCSIFITSIPGKGTTVTITIPKGEARETPAPARRVRKRR